MLYKSTTAPVSKNSSQKSTSQFCKVSEFTRQGDLLHPLLRSSWRTRSTSDRTHRRESAMRRYRKRVAWQLFPFYCWHWHFVAKMTCKIQFLPPRVGK